MSAHSDRKCSWVSTIGPLISYYIIHLLTLWLNTLYHFPDDPIIHSICHFPNDPIILIALPPTSSLVNYLFRVTICELTVCSDIDYIILIYYRLI